MIVLPSSFSASFNTLFQSGKKHSVLLAVLCMLFALSMTARTLLLAESSPPSLDPPSATYSPYSCSADGTPFAVSSNLDELQRLFDERLSRMIEERLAYLSTPSRWSCNSQDDPPSSLQEMQRVADEFAGWSRPFAPPSGGVFVKRRPVVFESFSSIVGEMLRAYDCRMATINTLSIAPILKNADFPEETKFCCAGAEQSCVVKSESTTCLGNTTTDPLCDGDCEPSTIITDVMTRLVPYQQSTLLHRKATRITTERALLFLRSYEMNQRTARNIQCTLRLSLDLKNELSLLADAMSCLPRIWDSATSLHDPQ
jgi:hypothetical protein